jgi:hypothetical protein
MLIVFGIRSLSDEVWIYQAALLVRDASAPHVVLSSVDDSASTDD